MKKRIIALTIVLMALGVQAQVQFKPNNGSTDNVDSYIYTFTDVSDVNLPTSGEPNSNTGSFSGGEGSVTIKFEGLYGYTNALAIAATNNFGAYLATMTQVQVAVDAADWGVNAGSIMTDADWNRINPSEIGVFTFDTSALTEGELTLQSVAFDIAPGDDYDLILFNPTSNSVESVLLNQSGSGTKAFTNVIHNGSMLLVAMRDGQNAAREVRIDHLWLDIPAPIPSSNQPPFIIGATASNSRVLLEWQNDLNLALLDHYDLYRSITSNEVDFSKIISTTENTYTDTNATNETTYYYKAKAVSTNGQETAFGNMVSATPSMPIPTGLQTDAGDAQVVLTWDAPSDPLFAGFTIYRTTTSGSNYTAIASNVVNNTYTDTTVLNDTIYYYVVTHNDLNGGESGYSNEESVMPSDLPRLNPVADAYVRDGTYADNNYGAENALEIKEASENYTRRTYLRFDLSSVTGGDIGQAVLRLKRQSGIGSDTHTAYVVSDDSWAESSITWSNKPSHGPALGSAVVPPDGAWLELDVTSQVASDWRGDQAFSVLLISDGDSLVSYYSREADSSVNQPQLVITVADADTTPPAMPTGLAAVANNNSVELNWDDNAESDLGSYRVYRSVTSSNGYASIATGLGSSAYIDTQITNGTTYYYVVTALDNSANESLPSEEVSTTGVVTTPLDSFTRWAEYHGLSGENASLAADSDAGGFNNLMEFAFGGDPEDWTDDQGLKPTSKFVEINGTNMLTYTFRRIKDRSANRLEYIIETTDDLTANYWSAYHGTFTTEEFGSDPDLELVTVYIPASYTNQFVRLRIPAPSLTGTLYSIASQTAFDAYNHMEFEPGDQILFKRGETYQGMFEASGTGTETDPIQMGVYGEGTNRPLINAQGHYEAGVKLNNISFWEVDGLEITNPYTNSSYVVDGHSTLAEKKLFGLLVRLDGEEKTYEHIYINDCYVHDVNDMVGEKEHGGIHVRMYDLSHSIVHNLRITKNRVERVGGVGIANQSSCAQVFNDYIYAPRYLWTQVYVADNVVDTTGRNTMIARASTNAVYERNVLANSSRADTGHNIFPFNTVGIKIQHNEAYGNIGLGGDRGGYDADYNNMDTYIQYNYSHDNEWFCGIMKRKQENVYIRYNVSVNERAYYYGFNNSDYNLGSNVWWKLSSNINFQNNTHYLSEDYVDETLFDGSSLPFETRCENNIFYFAGGGVIGDSGDHEGQASKFDNNVYVNIPAHVTDQNPQFLNPLLVNPSRVAPSLIDLHTMSELSGYGLQTNSPYLTGANSITNNGGLNILGKPVDPNHYGAF